MRDVAFAHIQAIKETDAANKCFLIADQRSYSSLETQMRSLVNKYAQQGWPITPDFVSAEQQQRMPVFENESTQRVLHVTYRSLADSIGDMIDCMVELGSLKPPNSQEDTPGTI